MKFIANSEELSNALGIVSKALSVKPNIPILEGIRISAEGDTVTFSATDLELFIETKIKATVKIEGEVVVIGKFFNEFARKLTYVDTVEIEKGGSKLIVGYGGNETEVQCLEEETFPDIKTVGDDVYMVVKENELKEIIESVLYCVAQDDTRPILKGCLLELENERLTAVALDGFRLGMAKCGVIDSSVPTTKMVVPGKTLNDIVKILDDSDNKVKISVQKNFVMFDLGNTVITTRLIDGDYIAYKKIIPVNYTTRVTVNKDALETGLDRAGLIARNNTKKNYLKLSLGADTIEINSDSELGKIRETVNCVTEGKELEIAFNSRFLFDALNKVKEDFINIQFSGSTSPALILPKEGDKFLFMVLPIRMIG